MFELSDAAREITDRVELFFYPKRSCRRMPSGGRQAAAGQVRPDVEQSLKAEAKALGLWNMALPRLTDDEPGTRMSNLEFTGIAEILGRLPWASRVFNCHAPDTPNMELLQLFGTETQKARYLAPLLEGETGSCFGMTEPAVASSDPTNLQTRITRDGDEYVVNGRKWFSSNASLPTTTFCVLVGVTDPEAARSKQQSLVIVPLDTDGVTIERDVPLFGHVDTTGSHSQVRYDNVRIPADHLIGQEGDGFAIGQARLGTGPSASLHAGDRRV